ncbi:MAG: hypothetical protein PHD14_02980 [Dehalococcoidales bacterium]|jgi:hypothetical protein|nr:hypothetical protein [Dehalococcoidales bacterium]
MRKTMSNYNDRIEYAADNTKIIRFPKQKLSTFGQTNIKYYMVTEPIYGEFEATDAETIVRQGYVIAEKPRIITPYYMSRLEGFSSEAKNYFSKIGQLYGADSPGIYYSYSNQSKNLSILSECIESVVDKLNEEIEGKAENLSAIIVGQDDLWDVSLLKFIYELTQSSLYNNLNQFEAMGLLNIDSSGIPNDARLIIEELFEKLARGKITPGILKKELQHWGLFEIYQDRFFAALQSGK